MTARQAASIEARYGPIVAKVKSRSDPGTTYEVRRSRAGDYSCPCRAWVFSKGQPRSCYHTIAAIAAGQDKHAIVRNGRDVAIVISVESATVAPLEDPRIAAGRVVARRMLNASQIGVTAFDEAALTAMAKELLKHLHTLGVTTSLPSPAVAIGSGIRRIIIED